MVAVALVHLTPIGGAVMLGSEDAGTGADAPESNDDAVPIETGTFAGSLAPGYDTRDAYRVWVGELETVLISVEFSESVEVQIHGPTNNSEWARAGDWMPMRLVEPNKTERFTAFRAGYHVVSFELPRDANKPGVVEYTFTWSKHRAANVVGYEVVAAAVTFTVHWTKPTQVAFETHTDLGFDRFAAGAALERLVVDAPTGRQAFATAVLVPDTDLGLMAHGDVGYDGRKVHVRDRLYTVGGQNGAGSEMTALSWTSLGTDEKSRHLVIVSPDEPFEAIEVRTSNQYFVFDSVEALDRPLVEMGNTEKQLMARTGMFGYMSSGSEDGLATGELTVTAPDGRAWTPAESCGCRLVRQEQPGRRKVEINDVVAVGPKSNYPFFVGADIVARGP